MSAKAIIIVPSQGHSVNSFIDTAQKLKSEVYSNNAIIVKTTLLATGVGGKVVVSFALQNGSPFSWNNAHNLSSILTISHGGFCDGPVLAAGAAASFDNQPWGTRKSSPRDAAGDCQNLSDDALEFWKMIGKALSAKGKIILIGCSMGEWAYAGEVAKVTGKRTYASTSSFGAGNAQSAIKYVRAIERGHAISPMKTFKP